MWFVLFGEFGECVAEFDTEAEALAYIEAQECPDDYWVGTDEYDYSDYDAECGFDPYMGDYSYDC
jgi:hypothetical protein